SPLLSAFPYTTLFRSTRRLDLCVCGGLRQPGIFPIGGICSCRALAALQRLGEVWIADLEVAARTRSVMFLSTPLHSAQDDIVHPAAFRPSPRCIFADRTARNRRSFLRCRQIAWGFQAHPESRRRSRLCRRLRVW